MSDAEHQPSKIYEFSAEELAQAPAVSEEFQAKLATWAGAGYKVTAAKGMVTRVFVEDGVETHIFDENGQWIRSTDR